MNLSGTDLNLLLVLHAVLRHGSVAAAAETLHVTPSAISNALARLRSQLKDPLFVRRGRGLTPTPRAQELAPLLASALSQLERVVGDGEAFDPARTTRDFSIAMADADQIASLPGLSHAFVRALPHARLRVVSIDALISGGGLAGPVAELAIAPEVPDPELRWHPLYQEDAVVVMRIDHPLMPVRKECSKELFHALRHVDTHLPLGRPGVGHRMAEDSFSRAGLERDIAVVVPTFSAAALVAARTDLLAALPRRVAQSLSGSLPLRVLELPGHDRSLSVGLAWHQRVHHDAATTYFRELVLRYFGATGRGRRRPSVRSA